MRALSIWSPFASLLVTGCKIFETRTWAPPASLIGERIAIASTKTILPAQRAHWADPEFQRFYARTGLPAPEELPRGHILGHVRLDSFELMDEEMMDDVSLEEQSYGWWEPGFYAWRMVDPVALAHPIPVKGKQGVWVYEETFSMLKNRRKDAKRLVRRGRRIYGGVYLLASGKEVYLAWRKTSEIFRGGEKLLSDAVALGKASWAIDDETLLDMRREGVTLVGVLDTETGDKYVTTIDTFFDRAKAKIMNYESRGGALQRYLPLAYFTRIPGATKIR